MLHDVIIGFPPDALHAIYLGVVKQLTEQLLLSSNFRQKFYINPAKQQQINDILISIKPPKRVSRPPRSLKNMKFYKGHEFMMLLLYYFPVILYSRLESAYFQNWMYLARGVSILSSEKVTEGDIAEAESLLEKFSSQIGDLYGYKHQRFNVHLLLHLGQFVRVFGPLQDFSMTCFENFNMQLQKYVKSSFGVGNQICKRYFCDLIHKCHNKVSKASEFQSGKRISYQPTESENAAFREKNINPEELTFYSSIQKGKLVIQSEKSSKSVLRDNSWFLLDQNNVFQAKVFAYYPPNRIHYGIGTSYKILPHQKITLPHCYEFESSAFDIVKIPLNAKILLYFTCDGNEYIFKFLNDSDGMNE